MDKGTIELLRLFAQEGADATGEEAADAGQRETTRADTRDAAAEPAPQGRMTWEEVKADPQFNREIQNIIRSRLRSEKRQSSGSQGEFSRFEAHFRGLEQQAEAMKELVPDFDLRTALADPAFARMTAPDVGIRVEDAYYALHRKEIQQAAMQVAAQRTAQMISDSIRSGRMRPSENGTSPQGASLARFDHRGASPEQRAALKKKIREAAARGEKLYPGM